MCPRSCFADSDVHSMPQIIESMLDRYLTSIIQVQDIDIEGQQGSSAVNENGKIPTESTNGGIQYPPMGFGKHKPKMLLMGLKR